jgi:hypothetical protein
MRIKLLGTMMSAFAITTAMVLGTGIAQASAAMPATYPQYVWTSSAGYGAMWYNTTNTIFYSSHSNNTPLRGDLVTYQGEQWTLPNGQCLTWYEGNFKGSKGKDLVDEDTCGGYAYQTWILEENTATSEYNFVNLYAAAQLPACAGGAYPVLTAQSSGGELTIECPTSGASAAAQQWTEAISS